MRFDFYSCGFLKFELIKHRGKLLKLTKISQVELDELMLNVLGNIQFIDETFIPVQHLILAEKLTIDIDPDDTPFVALTAYLNGLLWTGDQPLIDGLKQKGFIQTITTAQLSVLFDELEIGD